MCISFSPHEQEQLQAACPCLSGRYGVRGKFQWLRTVRLQALFTGPSAWCTAPHVQERQKVLQKNIYILLFDYASSVHRNPYDVKIIQVQESQSI